MDSTIFSGRIPLTKIATNRHFHLVYDNPIENMVNKCSRERPKKRKPKTKSCNKNAKRKKVRGARSKRTRRSFCNEEEVGKENFLYKKSFTFLSQKMVLSIGKWYYL